MTIEHSPETERSERAYRDWLRAMHGPALSRRTAERHAAFFLPHLRPGMRLLDAGCGGGSITVGLAAAVAPGETVGIDVSAESLEAARALATDRGCENARFEVGDVYRLPFEDASFDAVFAHALLQHLPEPLRAVQELRRVLRPGGVIGIADADWGGSLIWPASPGIDRSIEVMAALREMDGGSPYVGRELRALLHDAGFARTVGLATADAEGEPARTAGTGAWWAAYTTAPAFIDHAVALGLSTEDELRGIGEAWRAWGAHPGAYWARFWNAAVGWAPDAA